MSNLLHIAGAFAHEQLQQHTNIKGVLLVGSVARNDATPFSDVDLRFLIEGETNHLSRIDGWREGVYIDGTPEPFELYSSLESILSYPIRANDMKYGHILYDPDNVLHNLQSQVRQHFMEHTWVSQRVKRIAERIPLGLRSLEQAISNGDPLSLCHYTGRLAFHLALLPLIQQGVSPSSTRHLAQLGNIAPNLKERIHDFEGSTHMTVANVLSLANIVERWGGSYQNKKQSDLGTYMLEKARWMANNHLYKEAVHALWINVSFKAFDCLNAETQNVQQSGSLFALEWLRALGWQGEFLLKQKLKLAREIWRDVKTSAGAFL
jgi:hypothetical protein